MDIKRIVLNEVSYFKISGARSILPEEIKRRGFKKSLIVTDKDLIKYL
jgi:lactaldehyde reductase